MYVFFWSSSRTTRARVFIHSYAEGQMMETVFIKKEVALKGDGTEITMFLNLGFLDIRTEFLSDLGSLPRCFMMIG